MWYIIIKHKRDDLIMDNTYLDRVFADAKSEIEHEIDKFRSELDAGHQHRH